MMTVARRLAALMLVAFGAAVAAACSPEPPPTPTPTRVARPLATATLPPRPTSTPSPTAPPSPTPDAGLNPLTGLWVTNPVLMQRRPIHVCIDNFPAARPQYGLSQAEMIFEYVMEGYFDTRFTAVFWANEVDSIGPLRSARLVNFELTPMMDGALVCSGAADENRWYLKNTVGFPYLDVDLDDPTHTVYTREAGRMPIQLTTLLHTSTRLLHQWLADIRQERAPNIRPYAFSLTAPQGVPATTVHVPYPDCCAADWIYDTATGTYRRLTDGKPHMDATTNSQLAASNVVIVVAPHEKTTIIEDPGTGATSIRIVLTGEGKAIVIRDGTAVAGTWKRTDRKDLIRFYDAGGIAIPLHPGQTWVEIVPPDYQVTVK